MGVLPPRCLSDIQVEPVRGSLGAWSSGWSLGREENLRSCDMEVALNAVSCVAIPGGPFPLCLWLTPLMQRCLCG